MKIADLFEDHNDDDHGSALERTGFWGNEGAGCIFYASDTKRFLIAHRSGYVEQPHTWGTWGGAIDRGENPAKAVEREAHEEAGYSGKARFIPLLVFQAMQGGKIVFQYHNFLAVVPEEFTPSLNWESNGFRWCEFNDWPSPLHFGLTQLFADAKSMQIIKDILASHQR